MRSVGFEHNGRAIAPSPSQVSVIVPTLNERENIGALVDAICGALRTIDFEVLVVDDASSDGTGAVVEAEASQRPNLHLVRRPRKMGLASAVLDGTARSTGGIVVMMDADFSHDPEVLPRLVAQVQAGHDVAIGSRYVRGGHLEGWPLHRRIGSAVFSLVARAIFRPRVRDPLSGFAAFRRDVLEDLPTRFSAGGFKLLLEVLATRPSLRVCEVPISFADRLRGTSKLDLREIGTFAVLCYRLLRWRMGRRVQIRRTCAG